MKLIQLTDIHLSRPEVLVGLTEAYSVIAVRGEATTVMMVEFGYRARAGVG